MKHHTKGTASYLRKFTGFNDLMPHKVQDILVVSSPYDAFILEEEGNLSEKIFSEYVALHIRHSPRLTLAGSGEEAIELLEQKSFDLILSMTRLVDMNIMDFGKKAKTINPKCPVVLLAYNKAELVHLQMERLKDAIDRVFVWSGNASILITIIKSIEDALNVDHDTQKGLVRVIIVIEDSVRYYSLFLPLIYTQMMQLTRELMDESLNDMHKLLRMRARPKILLAQNFEEGMELFRKYRNNVLGVISDIQFNREGKADSEAGFEITRRIKAINNDIPVLLQSAKEENRIKAEMLGAKFLNKRSRHILEDLKKFIMGELGFGEFVFKTPDGREITRAANTRELEQKLYTVPAESLIYHSSRNHFSNWLMARTEFDLAREIAPGKPSDYETPEHLRRYLIGALSKAREETQRGVITEFSKNVDDFQSEFVRLGSGSMGGKARGLGFIDLLLSKHHIKKKYPKLLIKVPKTVVISTDEYDRFIERNNLGDPATKGFTDKQIAKKFLSGKICPDTHKSLKKFIQETKCPLAVRSSSLLEDSHYQPFAGIYSTYMLPNNNASLSARMRQLATAIKLIYASVFMKKSISFLEATEYSVDEEKMAIIVQELVGKQRGDYFYPLMSGVAQSYNYYPFSYQTSDEGVVHLALGLGKMIVEGGNALRFSPAKPKVLPQFYSADSFVKNSQRNFFALGLKDSKTNLIDGEDATLVKLDLEHAEKDGALAHVASVYVPDDDIIRDSLDFDGPRIVTFASALKYNWIPLPQVLSDILEMGKQAMGTDIEIEFAVELSNDENIDAEFYFLQIRPLAVMGKGSNINIKEHDRHQAFCASSKAMGNGIVENISDVVFVDPESFDKSETVSMADEIGKINDRMRAENKNYILIGPGRWGTLDRWLGIPVEWEQISRARLIVEAGLPDLNPTPSYGSHFFQNITSLNVGYLTVPYNDENDFVDWEWLRSCEVITQTKHLKHVRTPQSVEAKIDGRTRHGIIMKTPTPGQYE